VPSSPPPWGPLFAIGDVHGCADELEELLEMLPLRPGCTVVFLGDYIDRGPKSRQVVDIVLRLREKHHVVTLRGNHESMLLEFLSGKDPQKVARYVLNGGSATLAGYADENGRYQMPAEHVAFFENLALSYETAEHFFVHAGVPNVRLADLDREASSEHMLWVRNKFLHSTFRWEKIIVHGHTVVETVEISASRICLDTGCVFDRRLTAMEFPSHRIYSVDRRDHSGRTLLKDASRRAAVRFHGAIPVQLEIEGQSLPFETVDYSEIGLGVRALASEHTGKLTLGDVVRGRVGVEGLFQIPFQGRVARVSWEGDDEVLGLDIEVLDHTG
jgi:serine/threonine protein phosphatase 1